MTMFKFYLLFVLVPALEGVACLAFMVSLVLAVALGMHSTSVDHTAEESKIILGRSKIWLISAVFFSAVAMCSPTKKDMIAMTTIPYVSQIKDINKVPAKLVKRLNEMLSEEVKDD